MKKWLALVLIVITNCRCAGSGKTSSSPIGIIRLANYSINSDARLPDSINYFFFTKEEMFYKNFSMTKASPGTVVIPDFAGQSVVAIALPPSPKVISVEINAAETEGKNLNVFYSVTDTTSWKSYPHIPFVAFTVPRITDLKQVNFYRNKTKEKTLSVVN